MNSKRGVWVSAIVLSILNISPLCQATSVYTIDHSPSAGVGSCTLIAFDIENNQFVYRDSVLLPEHGWGGIDIAIDELTNTLFVSFEWGDGWGGNIVEIVDAQTLSHEAITIDGVSNLTALLFDKENRRLLATDRDTNFLHILKWNPVDETLALEETIQLENITYATDLAIHEDTLYVSEYDYWWGETYTEVYLYDLSENFSYLGKLDIGEDVIAIDYNEKDGILYSVSASTTKLSKFTDPNTISKSVGATVLCVAADDETAGRVFLTTYRDGIEMWDTENWTQDPNIPPDPNFTDIYDNSNTDGVYVGNLAGIITAEDYKPDLIDIIKVDDVNDFDCVSPVSDDPNMVYTIGISSIIYDHNDVWVVDYLPREVDFVSASPEDTTYGYDPYTHTYVWYLAGLEGYDPNPPPADPNTFFILNVKVNEWAEPLSTFINEVTVESDISDGSACHETDVCCWTHPDSVSGVIYVDQRAIENAGYIEIGGMEYWWAYGKNTGTCWTDAYRNLQDALDRAGLDCGSIIRVADGTYRPGNDPSEDYFDVPDRTVGYGVEIYGGYAGYGATDPNERDWKRYKTILSGFIGEDDEQYIIRNNTVITMGDNSLLDGFTVEEGRDYGIYGSGDDFSIKNSLVKNNNETGVNCENGELTIQWCQIYDNVRRGINHTGSGKTLTIENCRIYDNQWDGVRTVSSTSQIKNSIIYMNGSGGNYYGINILNPSYGPDIHNNTIVDNINEGIRFIGDNTPDVRNCILWYNNDDAGVQMQIEGLDYSQISYCCFSDPNDPNCVNPGTDPVTGNITYEPDFVYDNPPYGYYHIKYESPCRNGGDPNTTPGVNEVDMDGEPRIADDAYDIVDIGADEVACEDTWHENDWTYDGVINLKEYAILSAAWLTHAPNDPALSDPNTWDPNDYTFEGWNPICNLDDTGNSEYEIDLADLTAFCEDNPKVWLWEACWRENYVVMYGMSGGGESMMMAEPAFMPSSATLEPPPVEEEPPLVEEEPPPVPEKSIAERILDLEESIEFLEEIWLEDPYIQQEIDSDDWNRFMDAVYDGLDELKI